MKTLQTKLVQTRQGGGGIGGYHIGEAIANSRFAIIPLPGNEMKLVVQDPALPDWVDRYEIHEQTRQNVAGKLGKDRPIMDIEIERHHRGPRPSRPFEAKPLGGGSKKTIGRYLGEEGLPPSSPDTTPQHTAKRECLATFRRKPTIIGQRNLRKNLLGIEQTPAYSGRFVANV